MRETVCVYTANIAEMADREQRETLRGVFDQVQSEGRLAEILTSYSEGIELVDALTALRKKQVTIPDGLLKRVLDGPSDASLEDHKSNRRDGHVKKQEPERTGKATFLAGEQQYFGAGCR